MKGAMLCPLLLAATFLLGAVVEVAAQPPPMMREGDMLSSLIYNYSSGLKKRTTAPTFGQMLDKQALVFNGTKCLPQQGLKDKDKIAKLPGQPRDGVDFDQYAGYVTVHQETGRALFYYFTEAPEPAAKPLLLWLNGGPGCSSFGVGAMEELGPFRVNSDGKTLYMNPYAWNRVANVLFFESPAGVGFSYSNTTSDYEKNGDTRTAEDSYVFLVNWLERFPGYKSRDLYIVGESYAGHYVPQLAHTILRHNQFGGHKINLKGIAIGNAVINDLTDQKGTFDFWWTHALVSDEAHQGIAQSCDFTSLEGFENDKCMDSVIKADEEVPKSKMDIYNIYGPRCSDGNLTAVPKQTSIESSDPCSNYYVNAYLNDPDVQKALHANVTKLQYPWNHCTHLRGWLDRPDTVLPLLKELMQNGLRVWVYSGDVDGRVPVTASRYSVAALNLTVKTPWQAWAAADVAAGYSEVYHGDLTLATVRGAGHMVPKTQGLRALVMVTAFLEGKPLPSIPIPPPCC